MIRKWFGITALIFTAIAFLNLSSCGRNQELVSIQVQPTAETFVEEPALDEAQA